MALPYNEILFRDKKKRGTLSACSCERSQSEKVTYCMIPAI
jgi:hypothetical protein